MDRRSQILTIAGHLFSQRGYHATSMRELARHLNLQGGSLYAHIQSKEELLLEVVRQAAERFQKVLEELPSGDPVTRMKALVKGHLRVIAEELPRATVFFHEWKHLSPPLLEEAKALRRRYEEGVQAVVEEGGGEEGSSGVLGLVAAFLRAPCGAAGDWWTGGLRC